MTVGAGEEAIFGKDNSGGEEREAARAMATRVKRKYGAHPFTVQGGDADKSIKLFAPGPDGAFTKMVKAHHLIVRTDNDIFFALDLASNDKIKVEADVPYVWDITEFGDVFFTGGGVDAIVLVEMA